MIDLLVPLLLLASETLREKQWRDGFIIMFDNVAGCHALWREVLHWVGQERWAGLGMGYCTYGGSYGWT